MAQVRSQVSPIPVLISRAVGESLKFRISYRMLREGEYFEILMANRLKACSRSGSIDRDFG